MIEGPTAFQASPLAFQTVPLAWQIGAVIPPFVSGGPVLSASAFDNLFSIPPDFGLRPFIDTSNVFSEGADLVLSPGVSLAELATTSILLTSPSGIQQPPIAAYIGTINAQTYSGTFLGRTYIVGHVPSFVLTPGTWTAQLSYTRPSSPQVLLGPPAYFTV